MPSGPIVRVGSLTLQYVRTGAGHALPRLRSSNVVTTDSHSQRADELC